MLPKVSIVVPIYNVEKYLNRCIESILNQTYSNIEVILVNDGSPDNCGEICESYKKKDHRVKVIHKDNGGLSDARNNGINLVEGVFTFFVDSDDWLENIIIEELVNKSLAFNADVIQCAYFYAYDDHLLFDNRYSHIDQAPTVLDNKCLMSELVKNERIKNFAWGKLYRTEIIKDIPFDKGVLFEDVFWAHKVMHRVSRYVILNQPMYYYYQRNDSIVATYSTKNLDFIKGLKERHRFIEEFYTDLVNESYKVILKNSLIHFNLLIKNRSKDKEGVYRREIQQYIKQNYYKLKKAVNDDKQLRRQLSLFIINPYLNVTYLVVNKFIRKMKIFQQPSGLERINVNQVKNMDEEKLRSG